MLVPKTADGLQATVTALRSLDGSKGVSFHTFSDAFVPHPALRCQPAFLHGCLRCRACLSRLVLFRLGLPHPACLDLLAPVHRRLPTWLPDVLLCFPVCLTLLCLSLLCLSRLAFLCLLPLPTSPCLPDTLWFPAWLVLNYCLSQSACLELPACLPAFLVLPDIRVHASHCEPA
jgi:hypothetical protein